MKRSLSLLFLTCFIFSSVAVAADKVVVIPLGGGRHYIRGSQIIEVTSAGGQIWMDRNIGALRVATKSNDPDAYGSLYQWGRAGDRHQNPSSSTTTSTSDNPTHGLFITGSNDWRTTQDNDLWDAESKPNNPCPAGFRLPTAAEWDTERSSWGSGNNNAAGAFASPLKLVAAGYRYYSNGTLYNVGSSGGYWSGAVAGGGARSLYFSSGGANMSSHNRANGLTVRCLKD